MANRKVKEFTFQRNLKPIGERVGEAREKDDQQEVRIKGNKN